ncbi:hypothetical protein MRB53_033319 [Persea americana]|uniref:Uncharacterized protein n=1 Tax=Persea americana TaxID=3435 RepID=A0ACC2KU67_PERAE|nr:hypothetical protein MRB53_033319 [Persea americana]
MPLLELLFVFWYLTLLLWLFMHMAATGVFFSVDPITPLIIENMPQVPLVSRRSLAVPGWRTRSTATHRRRAQSPSIPELLLEPLDELFLLLDEEVLGHDSVMERIFMVVEVGLMMRLNLCGLLTWLGDRFVTLPGRARTSHRSVMAYSAFSNFTGTRNGPAGLTFSWYLRRAAELSNAELTLLTEPPNYRGGNLELMPLAKLPGYGYREWGKTPALYRDS